MAQRLHVRKVNRVEFSDGIFPSGDNTFYEIDDILINMSESGWQSDDEKRLEIPKDDFRKGVENIRRMTDDTFSKKYPRLSAAGYTPAKTADALQSLLDESDSQDENVSLDWF